MENWRILDLTGIKFNKLLVVEATKERTSDGSVLWLCKCDCGNKISVSGFDLRIGKVVSCGCVKPPPRMGRYRDLTNQKFGRLTALYPTDLREKGGVVWMCLCECGEEKLVVSAELTRAKNPGSGKGIRSCGCLNEAFPNGEAAFNRIYSNYRGSARNRNFEFSLEKEEFRKLITSTCFYCGTPPNRTTNTRRPSAKQFTYNGIDRIDNEKGYIGGNCVPCCRECNFAKRNMTQENFINWVACVYENLVEKRLIK